MIPSEPTRIRISACEMRSELTTAPIVVRLRCSAIGPSASCSATATSPSLPWVGILVLPVGADDGAGEVPGDAEAPGDADGVALGLGLGLGAGLPLAVALALAAGLALALAAALALGAALPLGAGDRSGSRRSVSWMVLISMKPEPVVSAVASRPWDLNTASTWLGVTLASAKRISQRVPPV